MTLQGQYFKIPISKCQSPLHEHLPSYTWKEHKETVWKSGTIMNINIDSFDIMNAKAINRSNIWGSHSVDDEDSCFRDVTAYWLVNSDHMT